MKNKVILLAAAGLLSLAACNKKDDNNGSATTDFNTLKTKVLADFTNNVAVAGYSDLKTSADDLYAKLQTLNNSATDANLSAARDAWKKMRGTWEQCEGFLFGPVEDNDYDPNMDTWPTDYNQMDSLMANASAFTVADVQNYTLSLRGYHPIEYVIFGKDGNKTAADLTAKEKEYMMALAEDLKNTCTSLYSSWSAAPENYAQQVITAGAGSTKYTKKQDVYLAIIGGMMDICEEVGTSKMKDPYDAYLTEPALAAFLVESPYAGTSIADFKNNLIGLQNVYLGTYNGKSGLGLKDLVAAKNKSLDNNIQTKIAVAVSSFDNITLPYGQAIAAQRTQIQATMAALDDLKNTLENDLEPFIKTNITD
ncbi:imelysin family protein [Taibaiella soli]|nr:imelysin family protein [Taibaiella soli]